jgi:uncharacterized protein (TIRG00374 family)
VKLLAVRPAGDPGRGGRGVRELLVLDPDTGLGRRADPSSVTGLTGKGGTGRLTVSAPFVEQGVSRMVREAQGGYLLAAVFIIPLSYLLTSLRWQLLLGALDIRLSAYRTFSINMAGAFYNAFMPGTTGGDLIKAYYVARHTPHRTRAVMSVLVDRAIGLLALIMLGGLMASLQYYKVPDCRKVAIASLLVLTGVAVGLLVFYTRLRRLTGLDFLLRRLPLQKQVSKAVETMEIYGRRPGLTFLALLISFPVHITSILSATFAGWAFGLALPTFYYWVVVPVIALAGAIPISPQGMGVMEPLAVELTKRHGVSVGQAFILTMSIRLVQMVWSLVAGLFVLRGGYHPPTTVEQQDLETDSPAGAVREPAQAVVVARDAGNEGVPPHAAPSSVSS